MEQEELGFISIEKMDHLFLEQFKNASIRLMSPKKLHGSGIYSY